MWVKAAMNPSSLLDPGNYGGNMDVSSYLQAI
jgi:hypothetical protein